VTTLNYPQAFMQCRDVGHAWEVELILRDESDSRLVRRTARCLRCQTVRTDVIRLRDGLIWRRGYQYPNGYHVDKERNRKALWRREFCRFLLEEVNEQGES